MCVHVHSWCCVFVTFFPPVVCVVLLLFCTSLLNLFPLFTFVFALSSVVCVHLQIDASLYFPLFPLLKKQNQKKKKTQPLSFFFLCWGFFYAYHCPACLCSLEKKLPKKSVILFSLHLFFTTSCSISHSTLWSRQQSCAFRGIRRRICRRQWHRHIINVTICEESTRSSRRAGRIGS